VSLLACGRSDRHPQADSAARWLRARAGAVGATCEEHSRGWRVSRTAAASADSAGGTSYDGGGQSAPTRVPISVPMRGRSIAKPPPNPAATLPVIKPAARILGRAIDRILLCELWNRANAPLVCWQSGKRSARWPEKLLTFWMVFPAARLPDSMTSMTWTNCRPDAKDSHREDGGLTEANAKDAYRQVGKANLELEWITGRPADGLCDRVRKEEVSEESTNSASGDTYPKQIQQKYFQPTLAGPTTPVQNEMTRCNNHRQDGEAEHTDRNTVQCIPLLEEYCRRHLWAAGGDSLRVSGLLTAVPAGGLGGQSPRLRSEPRSLTATARGCRPESGRQGWHGVTHPTHRNSATAALTDCLAAASDTGPGAGVFCGKDVLHARARSLLPEKDSKIVGEDDGESDLRRTQLCAHHS
jgi:hypothetical protein